MISISQQYFMALKKYWLQLKIERIALKSKLKCLYWQFYFISYSIPTYSMFPHEYKQYSEYCQCLDSPEMSRLGLVIFGILLHFFNANRSKCWQIFMDLLPSIFPLSPIISSVGQLVNWLNDYHFTIHCRPYR